MKILTKQLKSQIPALYSTEKVPMEEKIAQVKLFSPIGNGTWYILEMDKDEDLCFGYVELLDNEFGYFSIKELEDINLPFGLKIERDLYFSPTPMSEII